MGESIPKGIVMERRGAPLKVSTRSARDSASLSHRYPVGLSSPQLHVDEVVEVDRSVRLIAR
jgi:hypothetical protein